MGRCDFNWDGMKVNDRVAVLGGGMEGDIIQMLNGQGIVRLNEKGDRDIAPDIYRKD